MIAIPLLVAALSTAQADRPNEDELFGGNEAASNAGATSGRSGSDDDVFGGGAASSDGGTRASDDDFANLSSKQTQSKFDTDEVKSDALKVGANLLMFGQAFWQQTRPFEKGAFSAPMILDTYLDGRPNDRLRAFAQGRLQFDPTRPLGTASGSTATNTSGLIGLTAASQSNPSVFLDQLWLRFDIARRVYFTIGRQKVRWGVSRIWYPTDFLNSQPRDALNPFDVRLGVNMIKVHVPVESLGWNFYGYGLFDSVNVTNLGQTLDQIGGALRAEIVLGPAEIGMGGVWQKGRRPRYAIDVSSAIGPLDVFAEAAFRSGRDFLKFTIPEEFDLSNVGGALAQIKPYRPEGIVVQVSGGVSWQFNYTDKNFGVLTAEYFYNPMGYANPIEYQIQTLGPSFVGIKPDPIQQVALYGAQHSLAVSLAAPGIPGADWITMSLSNIIILNDPSALTRLDVIFRVLNYLSVQAFGAIFYGQTGGQLRFRLNDSVVNAISQFAEIAQPGSGATTRASLSSQSVPPLLQAGVLLRLSI